MKKLVLLLLSFCFGTAVFAQENPGFTVLEPAEYERHITLDSIQFVDIRTPKEYEEGALKGAENIDFLAEDFFSNMEKFDREEPLYIYCRSGNRSARAAKKLSEMGFQNIIDLKGGYNAWQDFEKK